MTLRARTLRRNNSARQAIHQVRGCGIYAGNHADAGQVCIGNTGDLDLLRQYMNDDEEKYRYLPSEGLLFPNLLQPEPEATAQPEPNLSCAELVERGDQHLLVNDMMASVIGQYVHKLLHREPIRSFLTYISTGDLPGVRSIPICREELVAYLPALSSSH